VFFFVSLVSLSGRGEERRREWVELGVLLQAAGIKVTAIKIDPYLVRLWWLGVREFV